jgi:homoserine O-acetyltransferase
MLRMKPAAMAPTLEGTMQGHQPLAWAVYGDPALGARTGWTLVFHALTGSQRVHEWWPRQLAPSGLLRPDARPVLCANLPGSCYGSAMPRDTALTPRAMARAHLPLMELLGITRLALVTGGSLGGMVALEWLRISPVPVDDALILAAPARASAQVIAWNTVQRMAIEAGGAAGLAAARAAAMITYRSDREFEGRFGRHHGRVDGQYDVESWLRHHGRKLVQRFDAESYTALTRAMDAHDLGDPCAAAAETRTRCTRITGVGISSDQLFPAAQVRAWVGAYQAAGLRAGYAEIQSIHGHDAFLIEHEQVARLLHGAVR